MAVASAAEILAAAVDSRVVLAAAAIQAAAVGLAGNEKRNTSFVGRPYVFLS